MPVRRPWIAGVLAVSALAATALSAALWADQPVASAATLPEGVILVDAPIEVSARRPLIGEGRGRTILRAAPGYTGDMVVQEHAEAHNPDIRVQGVTLDCAGTARRAAHLDGADRLFVDDVEVTGCTGVGLSGSREQCQRADFSCEVIPSAFQARGFGAADLVFDQHFSNLHVHDNAVCGLFNGLGSRRAVYDTLTLTHNRCGLVVGGSEARLSNIEAHGNLCDKARIPVGSACGDGIYFRNLTAITASGLMATGNTRGVHVVNLVGASLSGVVAQNNRREDVWFDTYDVLPDNYGPTSATAVSGVAGPSRHRFSGEASAAPGEVALRVGPGESPDTSQLLLLPSPTAEG